MREKEVHYRDKQGPRRRQNRFGLIGWSSGRTPDSGQGLPEAEPATQVWAGMPG